MIPGLTAKFVVLIKTTVAFNLYRVVQFLLYIACPSLKAGFLSLWTGVLEFVLARLCNLLLGDLEVSGLSSWKYWDYGDT